MTTQFGSTDDLPTRRVPVRDALLSATFWVLSLVFLVAFLVCGFTGERDDATFWGVGTLIYLVLAQNVDRWIERDLDR